MNYSENKDLVSVIVPVYNVMKYLRECIDSILAQTMSSFELLLIDDGSTDGSGSICDEYGKTDDRIRVFHKENGGLSSARNKGLDEAKGEFICFIDSDDTVSTDFLEKLYDALISSNAEMSLCNIDSPKLSEAEFGEPSYKVMTTTEAKTWLYDSRSGEYVLMVVACNKLYKKDIFQDLRYPEGKLHEDEFVIMPLLNKCNTVAFVPDKLYHYKDNSEGITSDVNRMNIRHLDAVDALAVRTRQLLKSGDKEFAVITLKNALYKCARFYGDAGELFSNEMRDASKKKYCQVYFENKGIFNLKQKLKYFMFCVSPSMFVKIFNP
jgi:glycosyltransferase involved in cell wall biosynthesis